jgi:hypothetical protein
MNYPEARTKFVDELGGSDEVMIRVAEKVVEDAKSSPRALKRGHILNDLAARLKSGPSQKPPKTCVNRYFFNGP